MKLKSKMPKNSESINKKDSPQMDAITFSSNNSASEGLPISSQPRPPRNVQDLLRYSAEASTALGGTNPCDAPKPLDEESKKFLEGAVKSMTVDIVEELLNCIRILQNANTIPEDGDPTECEQTLDFVFDYVDNLDVANDFHKIGGFCVFKPCLESVHSSLRWRGAELIAELCQNNPYCQNKVLETGLMPSLLNIIDTDVDNTVRIKALYAVSCLARESEEGLREFTNFDGFSVLLRALQTDIQKLNIKSAFLLSSLCYNRPYIKDTLVNMGYMEQLIGQLSVQVQRYDEGHSPCSEHLLNAILSIIVDHRPAQNIARKSELQLKSLLDYVMKNSEDSDQYREENEYAKKLIKIVFGESENSDQER